MCGQVCVCVCVCVCVLTLAAAAPGYIDAGLAEGYFEAQPDPAAARASAGKLHALWRIGRADEVAAMAGAAALIHCVRVCVCVFVLVYVCVRVGLWLFVVVRVRAYFGCGFWWSSNAPSAVFLASDDASFVTGAAMACDGGMSSGLPPK
jgi:hypothetical protein